MKHSSEPLLLRPTCADDIILMAADLVELQIGMSAFLPKLDFLFCRLGRTPVECMNSRSLNIACKFTNEAFIESIYISEQDGMIFIMKCVS